MTPCSQIWLWWGRGSPRFAPLPRLKKTVQASMTTSPFSTPSHPLKEIIPIRLCSGKLSLQPLPLARGCELPDQDLTSGSSDYLKSLRNQCYKTLGFTKTSCISAIAFWAYCAGCCVLLSSMVSAQRLQYRDNRRKEGWSWCEDDQKNVFV